MLAFDKSVCIDDVWLTGGFIAESQLVSIAADYTESRDFTVGEMRFPKREVPALPVFSCHVVILVVSVSEVKKEAIGIFGPGAPSTGYCSIRLLNVQENHFDDIILEFPEHIAVIIFLS